MPPKSGAVSIATCAGVTHLSSALSVARIAAMASNATHGLITRLIPRPDEQDLQSIQRSPKTADSADMRRASGL